MKHREADTLEELVTDALQKGKVMRAINCVFNDALIEARKQTCDMDDPAEAYCLMLDILLNRLEGERGRFPFA